MWYIIGLIDTLIKGLEYGAIIIIPLLIVIWIISKKKVNNYKTIRKIILGAIVVLLLSSRIWGPSFFKIQIGLILENQTKLVEDRLEKKYNKNFTFVTKSKTKLSDKYAGSILGQNILYDYKVTYTFKDDDGVPAIVEMKLGDGYDYYQLRRTEYDIEQTVYNYARVTNITDEFYVKCVNYYETIKSSRLSDEANDDFMDKEMSSSNIYFVTTNTNTSGQIVSRALFQKYPTSKRIGTYEYVVSKDEYQNFKDYYDNYSYTIHSDDNYYKINEDKVISYKYLK